MIALYSSFFEMSSHRTRPHSTPTPRGIVKLRAQKLFVHINIKDLTLNSPQYVYARILSQSGPLSLVALQEAPPCQLGKWRVSSFFSWCHQRNIWRGLITFVLCLDLMTQAQMWQTLDDKKISSVIDRRCCEFY